MHKNKFRRVTDMAKKMRENISRWFGYMLREGIMTR